MDFLAAGCHVLQADPLEDALMSIVDRASHELHFRRWHPAEEPPPASRWFFHDRAHLVALSFYVVGVVSLLGLLVSYQS
jgi:hypothetical protein